MADEPVIDAEFEAKTDPSIETPEARCRKAISNALDEFGCRIVIDFDKPDIRGVEGGALFVSPRAHVRIESR